MKFNFWEKIPSDYYDKYDLSETVYINKRTKIKYICKIHGERIQAPLIFLERGCAACARERGASKRKNCQPDLNYFIEKSKKVHGDKYNYSLIKEYKGKKDILPIICPIHGVFYQEARIHYSGSGCPHCRKSKGEKIIREFLEKNNIGFISPKKFDDLKDKEKLSYDFYIKEKNLLIEYNGIQHYSQKSFNKSRKQFLIQKHHDWLKRKYAIKNNYNLLIIPYWENIMEVLNAKIFGSDLSKM